MDVISMLYEDILSFSGPRAKDNILNGFAKHRDLLAVTSRREGTHHRALRARHLRHNRYIRPQPPVDQRRLPNNGDTLSELLDATSVSGGYNGVELFVKLELDVSKMFAESIDELVRKPFDLLNSVDFIKSLFPSTSTTSVSGPLLNSSISFSAGAHASIRGELF
jgi:hypothetical protein